MTIWDAKPCLDNVALLAEGVGRNIAFQVSVCYNKVALLAEGVGRNKHLLHFVLFQPAVALLAEGVGRNQTVRPFAP